MLLFVGHATADLKYESVNYLGCKTNAKCGANQKKDDKLSLKLGGPHLGCKYAVTSHIYKSVHNNSFIKYKHNCLRYKNVLQKFVLPIILF